jgi:hypothetical protein
MQRHVYSEQDWNKLIRIDEAEPECGKDFCDSCGDCLHCYGGYCYGTNDGRDCWWVVYEDEAEATKEGGER